MKAFPSQSSNKTYKTNTSFRSKLYTIFGEFKQPRNRQVHQTNRTKNEHSNWFFHGIEGITSQKWNMYFWVFTGLWTNFCRTGHLLTWIESFKFHGLVWNHQNQNLVGHRKSSAFCLLNWTRKKQMASARCQGCWRNFLGTIVNILLSCFGTVYDLVPVWTWHEGTGVWRRIVLSASVLKSSGCWREETLMSHNKCSQYNQQWW